MSRRLRVLALATYPFEAAASRYRVVQFIEPLAKRGIDVTFSPFLDARLFDALYTPRKLVMRSPRFAWRILRRICDVVRATAADVVWVQREAMLFGPPVVEWLVHLMRRPIVLDLDDATYISYDSPVYGRLARFLKWPGKTDRMIRWSSAVLAGSDAVATHTEMAGTKAFATPSIVDLAMFAPREKAHRTPVVGWVGTHATYPFVETLLPLLRDLAREHEFVLRIVGSGRDGLEAEGLNLELKRWRLEEEVSDFQSLDIGLYPLTETPWNEGKSGFKAVQYMAVGVPFVMSPVGVCATLGMNGQTHFLARNVDEWRAHLATLLSDVGLRKMMGAAGRTYAEEHFGLEAQADRIADVLRRAATRGI